MKLTYVNGAHTLWLEIDSVGRFELDFMHQLSDWGAVETEYGKVRSTKNRIILIADKETVENDIVRIVLKRVDEKRKGKVYLIDEKTNEIWEAIQIRNRKFRDHILQVECEQPTS